MRLTVEPMEVAGVRLEPLGEAHREPLRAAANADAEIWALYPVNMAGEGFDPFWAEVTAAGREGRWLPFGVITGGACVGLTCFIAPVAANATVEIGSTYLHPAVRGGVVNPAGKRLMLGRAFDGGARRVSFRVDALNRRSRAAVGKLGATLEGVLRQDRVVWTGRVRDTAVLSILAEEWPAVRERLDARLAGFA